MKKKKALRRLAFQEILTSKARFISITLLLLLGVSFFSGINASGPDMLKTSELFFKNKKLMDIHVVSTMGLEEEDIALLKSQEDVEQMDVGYSQDVVTQQEEKLLKIFSYDSQNSLNQFEVEEGRYPKKSGEIALIGSDVMRNLYQIGDTVTFVSDKEDTDLSEQFKKTSYTVVGFVTSPMYVSEKQLGSSSIGNGSLDGYGVITTSDFNMSVYTDAYLTFKSLKNINPYSAQYKDTIQQYQEDIEASFKERASIRFATIKEEAQKKLDDAKEQVADGKQELLDGLDQLNDAETQIADGEKELSDLKEPVYYALSREDNPGYTEYADNAKRLSSLSVVFPAFFFAIAALVSLTTITRMIEEQRGQIGTLKAQGYTNWEISLKYYVYALSASIVGTVFGLVFGFYGIPKIIIDAYSSLYDFPNVQLVSYFSYGILSFGIAILCTGITAWVVLRQELKSSPAALMRQKAPKVGKLILLERITSLWNRLDFNQKVTMRNLFRYKQRMLMTVFGIAGCMGLMMTGFGLNDSIADLSELQYKTILRYQAIVVFDEDAKEEEQIQAQQAIAEINGLEDYLLVQQAQYEVKKSGVNTQQVFVIAPKELDKFSDFIQLRNRGSDSSYEIPEQGAVITEKLADLFGVKVGDAITITNSENQEFTVPIANITENYAGHYIYMSPQTYQECFHSTNMNFNGTLISYNQDKKWEDNLSTTLNQYTAIQAISFNSSVVGIFNDSMGSLNTVVVVLIIAAAVLAFVVLYNLTNINVSERIRELSTIKVLGFFDKEVTMYIYRENVILSLIGIFSGSFLGKFLHYFVLNTVSMDNMMFSYQLHMHSYLFAGILTLLFSSMVMWVMHNKLKHIDMIEALKSNE